MRSGPNNRRSRGRGNGGRRGGSPRNQNFESNGPDVKVRGSAQQVVDKYQALAREASTAGDPIKAEGYFQHAEHYLRVLSAQNANNNAADQQQARNNENGADGQKQPAEANGASQEENAGNQESGEQANEVAEAAADPASQEQPDVPREQRRPRGRRRPKNDSAENGNGAEPAEAASDNSDGGDSAASETPVEQPGAA